MIDRKTLTGAYRNANEARRSVTRALRRPRTYGGAAKELIWAGVNLAMYPGGVLAEKAEPDTESSLPGRYASELPLRYLNPEAASTPIIMLHGYFHNRSGFLVFRRALRRAGFRHVSSLNSNVIGHDVAELAKQLSEHVDRVIEETGATKVHLIGHSLGGLVARAYVQSGGEDNVHTCITLGTPHAGTYSAFAGRGRAARDLRPGSPFMRQLALADASDVRFVSYYSNLDAMIIPASSAIITAPGLKARNVLIKDLGHMSLLISQQLIRSIVDVLWHLDDQPESTTSNVTGMATHAKNRRA